MSRWWESDDPDYRWRVDANTTTPERITVVTDDNPTISGARALSDALDDACDWLEQQR